MLAGLLRADVGWIKGLGHDVAGHPEEAKQVLTFLPDDPLLYAKRKPLEYQEM